MDGTDVRILAILQYHGRRHLAEIAKEVDLSPPAVMERVKKLEAQGVIKGYHAVVDAKKVGRNITAFVGVSITQQRCIESFGDRMASHKDVLECHHVTGDESFILKVKTVDTASLEELLAEIHSLEGVSHTVTKVVLSTPREECAVPLPNVGQEPSAHPKGLKSAAEKRRLTVTVRK